MSAAPVRGRELLQSALALLEPHAAHPGTAALHDPIYGLLSERHPRHLPLLQAALADQRDHPAAAALRALLAPVVQLPPRTLAGVLKRDGPIAGPGELLVELERRLEAGSRVRAVLERRVHELEQHRLTLSRVANTMAAAAALLAVVAVLGWLAALGAWHIPWLEPPAPAGAGGAASTEGQSR